MCLLLRETLVIIIPVVIWQVQRDSPLVRPTWPTLSFPLCSQGGRTSGSVWQAKSPSVGWHRGRLWCSPWRARWLRVSIGSLVAEIVALRLIDSGRGGEHARVTWACEEGAERRKFIADVSDKPVWSQILKRELSVWGPLTNDGLRVVLRLTVVEGRRYWKHCVSCFQWEASKRGVGGGWYLLSCLAGVCWPFVLSSGSKPPGRIGVFTNANSTLADKSNPCCFHLVWMWQSGSPGTAAEAPSPASETVVRPASQAAAGSGSLLALRTQGQAVTSGGFLLLPMVRTGHEALLSAQWRDLASRWCHIHTRPDTAKGATFFSTRRCNFVTAHVRLKTTSHVQSSFNIMTKNYRAVLKAMTDSVSCTNLFLFNYEARDNKETKLEFSRKFVLVLILFEKMHTPDLATS